MRDASLATDSRPSRVDDAESIDSFARTTRRLHAAVIHPDLDLHGEDEPDPADHVKADPISPELILVSSPEVARRAREQLAPFPSYLPPPDDRRIVVTRPCPAPRVVPEGAPTPPLEPATTRPSKARWLAIAFAAVALGTVAAGVVIRERSIGRASEPPASSSLATPAGTRTATPNTDPGSPDSLPVKPSSQKKTTRGASPTSQAPQFTVTSDRAATRPATGGRNRPSAPPSKTPAFVPSRVFAWPADAAATGYLIRFFRNGTKVYETTTPEPRVTLPTSFSFLAGRYRWEVLPVLGSDPSVHYGTPIVVSRFVVTNG